MNSGVVVGGWEYVWMAYGLTFGAFLIYGVVIVTRLREEWNRTGSEGNTK